MLHSPERARIRERTGLGWFAVTPATPTGVIAARSLVYWSGDRRYRVNVAVVPAAALLAAVPLLVADVPPPVVAQDPAPLAALLLGWLPHDDQAYDSNAIWMHVASGVRGWADRVGRLVPIALIGLPLLAVGVPLSVMLSGDAAMLPALAGVCDHVAAPMVPVTRPANRRVW
jgi:ABC-2 type transport system permease protein